MKVIKVIYYLCCLFFFSTHTSAAQACLTHSWSTSLIDYTTKTKPTVEPKSQDLSSLSLTTLSDKTVKLASVNFIVGGDQMKGQKNGNGTDVKPTPAKCSSGQVLYNGQCVTPCDESKFPYTAPFSDTEEVSPLCSEVIACNFKSTLYYGCTARKRGYERKGYECVAPDCGSYPLASLDSSKGTGECKLCVSETKCKYTSCHQGYDLSGGQCVIHECSSTKYPYGASTTPNSSVGTADYCYSGTTIKWGYGSCKTGYTLSGGQCISTCNYTLTSYPANCTAVADGCVKDGVTYYSDYCTKCKEGYDWSNGKCTKACAYTLTSYPANCTAVADGCVKDGVTYYSDYCTKCKNGWSLSGGVCSENACDGFTSTTSSIANCQTTASCQKGASTKYKCTKCKEGYAFESGQCIGGSFNIILVTEEDYVKYSLKIKGSAKIDWGDDYVQNVNYAESTEVGHTYFSAGEYEVKITGTPTEIGGSHNDYPFWGSEVGGYGFLVGHLKEIKDVNLPSVESYDYIFQSQNQLSVTDISKLKLPSGLKRARGMFAASNITSFPELPDSLENGQEMFRDCGSIKTGNIPRLPNSLKDGSYMFMGLTELTGSITNLPDSLEDGTYMFYFDQYLTGEIPPLPKGLVKGEAMFRLCDKLTGNIPELPSSLVNGEAMFYSCGNLTGNAPTIPDSLENGREMFIYCNGLTGRCSPPDKKPSLNANGMYWYTQVSCPYGAEHQYIPSN